MKGSPVSGEPFMKTAPRTVAAAEADDDVQTTRGGKGAAVTEQPKAITFVMMEGPGGAEEDDWNRWYNEVHGPARFANGFQAFRRFRFMPDEPPTDTYIPDQPTYLAIYELPDSSVLKSEAYAATSASWGPLPPESWEHRTMTHGKFSRQVFEQIFSTYPDDAPVLPHSGHVFLSAHDVPADKAEEWNAWYDTEHAPLALGVGGFVGMRRFIQRDDEFPTMEAKGGVTFKYLALYDIDSERVFHRPEFGSYEETPWQTRVRSFHTLKMSNIYQEFHRAIAP